LAEEGFNAEVVEDIAVDVEDIVAAAEATPTKSPPSTVAVEADFHRRWRSRRISRRSLSSSRWTWRHCVRSI
jgi:hypothetical protein